MNATRTQNKLPLHYQAVAAAWGGGGGDVDCHSTKKKHLQIQHVSKMQACSDVKAGGTRSSVP